MRIVYMGTPEFSVVVLKALIEANYQVVGVVSQPDKRVGRKQVVTKTPVKAYAERLSIAVFQPENIRVDYDQVLAWEPDLIITCAYGQIIPKDLLEAPRLKAINVHASLLPKYRGGAPIQWAIMNGEKKTGITIMYMAEAMDSGDIISQRELEIHALDNSETLHEKLSRVGGELLVETLPSIMAGTNSRTPQNAQEVSFAYTISKADEWLRFDRPASCVVDHIRALDPAPGAYAMLDGDRFKIYQAKAVETPVPGQPGEILAINKHSIVVATAGETAIEIEEGQLAGRKRQSMLDILNGKHPFMIHKRFN